jgi:hypothetical protein
MNSRIVTIASNTFREAVRDRVLYNLIAFAVLLSGAAILVGQISIEIEKLVVINLGLTAVSLFGVVIAIFIGIGLVSKALGVHCRKIPRPGRNARGKCVLYGHRRVCSSAVCCPQV